MTCHVAASGSDLVLPEDCARKQTPKLILASMIAVLGFSCVGCGSNKRSDLGQVQGTVTMDGSPLADAQIIFSPEGGRPSTGVTDAAGKYTLAYIRDIKGAAVGKHSVRIETLPPPTSDHEVNQVFIEKIPAKYNAETTLTADVKPGENTVDFPLVSK